MITISLCYCGKKVFTIMKIWMIEKIKQSLTHSIKHHYLKKKIFIFVP